MVKRIVSRLLTAGLALSTAAQADALLDTIGNKAYWETYDWTKPIPEDIGRTMVPVRKESKKPDTPVRTLRSATVTVSGTPYSFEQLAPDSAPNAPYELLLIVEQQHKCDELLTWAQSRFGLTQRTLDASSTFAPDALPIGGNLTEEKWFQWDLGPTRVLLSCTGLTEKLSETSWAPRGGGAAIQFGPASLLPAIQPLVGYDCEHHFVPSSPDDPVPPTYGFYLDNFRGIVRTAYRTPIGTFRAVGGDVIEFGDGLSTGSGYVRRVNLRTGSFFMRYGNDASPQALHNEGQCVRTDSPTKLK